MDGGDNKEWLFKNNRREICKERLLVLIEKSEYFDFGTECRHLLQKHATMTLKKIYLL